MTEPVLEITMGMFALEFIQDCTIAVTGADLNTRLNTEPLRPWQSFSVKKGDHLKFNNPRTGLRAYLAIAAELQLDSAFDSVTTVLRENLPGLLGRALQVGDQVSGQVHTQIDGNRVVPQRFIPDYTEPLVLQLMPGYQFEQFPAASINQLFANGYQIQTNSNRMACLLIGQPIAHSITSLASEGIAYGSVQIPPDGQPIILLNDRQTMGGYPKPGCITRLSGSALAQRFSPTRVRFELTTVESAQQEYTEFLSFFTA
jgi:5-oxoprolinase (ATP-hydrolysing) subunit C